MQKRLISIIQDKPGITFQDLMYKTKINRKNLSYNIKRLGDLKYVWVVKREGIIGYEYITQEKLRDEIFNRLVLKLISNEIDEATFNKIKKKLDTMNVDKLLK